VEPNRHQKNLKKDYEEHRKPRSFREIWRENRAWLQYDEKEGDNRKEVEIL
jgi:hypothetical protein